MFEVGVCRCLCVVCVCLCLRYVSEGCFVFFVCYVGCGCRVCVFVCL